MARSVETVVVGAGQSGPVMSALLSRAGSANLVGLVRDAEALAATQ